MENKIDDWLKKLQKESWNLELLISGFSIFLLIQSGEALTDFGRYVQYHYGNQGSMIFALIFVGILRIAVLLLTINLVFHIILRGFWIGAIGLRSVQAKVDYEKLAYSDFFTKVLKSKVKDLDSSLAKLDRICSVIFSFTFLVVCMILSLFLTLIMFSFLSYGINVSQDIENTTIRSILFVIGISVILLFLFCSLIYLIDTLSLGFFKRYKWLSKIYYPIFWFYGVITMAGLYRSIYYHLVSHFPKSKLRLFLFFYMVIPVLVPFHKIDFYQFYPDEWVDQRMSSRVYEDLFKDNTWIGRASIPSRIIEEGSLMPLFIRYNVAYNEDILSLCNDYTPSKQGFFFSGFSIGNGLNLNDPGVTEEDPEKLMNCLIRLYEVHIDDSLHTEQQYYFYTHPNQGEKGLQTVLDIQYLQRGSHKIQIKTKSLNDDGELIKEDYIAIPFWIDK